MPNIPTNSMFDTSNYTIYELINTIFLIYKTLKTYFISKDYFIPGSIEL